MASRGKKKKKQKKQKKKKNKNKKSRDRGLIGDQIAYMSTRRTEKDTDLWVMTPSESEVRSFADALAGGGCSRSN